MKIDKGRHSLLVVGAIVLAVLAGIGVTPAFCQESESADPAASPDPQTPVFTDRVEVNIVNLYATVVDRKGNPVTGLTAEDFVVTEGGQTMEITNFTEIGTAGVGTVAVAGELEAGESEETAGATAVVDLPSQVAVVFDNTSLEKRQRKRVLKALVPWVPSATANGGKVMVAVLEPELKILQPFTSNPSLVFSAFDEVAQRPATGDMAKSNKRILQRNIQGTQTISTDLEMTPDENPAPSGGGGTSGGSGSNTQAGRSNTGMSRMVSSGEMGKQSARQYYAQIETLRRQEYARMGQALIGIDRLIRGVTGVPGRKDVLWVTEDLVMQPGIDVYQTFFDHFEVWARELNLDQPELWGTQLELRNQFMYIAGVSQIASTVLHVVDASDRDREAASADHRTTDFSSQATANPGGSTGGYNLATVRNLTEGGQYLTGATGGSFFGNSRNYDGYLEDLNGRMAAYYSIGYSLPGPADGNLHPVDVDVKRDGLRVLTHERVPNPTVEQHLANMAISRLLIDEGPNPLNLKVDLGPTEASENDRYIQEIRIQLPARNLYLLEEGSNRVGTLTVAIVASDPEGNSMPPRLLQINIKLPADRMTPETVAMARLRLMMEKDTKDLAVAVRDQGSGAQASILIGSGS